MSAINYDLTIIKGVVFDVDGVLSPATIPMDIDGHPLRMVNIMDGYALQLAVKRGLKIAIITGADSDAIRVRYSALGISDIFLKASKKMPILEQWMLDNGLLPENVAYAGDDIPDYEPMQHVGLSVSPADGAVEIKRIAGYISPVNGGYGVGRDLLEQIMRAQNIWMNDSKAFGW